jgi:TAT (twin-arginine translocation) pathway signal sequence
MPALIEEELMAKKKNGQGVSRRDFMKYTGAGAVAAGLGTSFLFPERAAA